MPRVTFRQPLNRVISAEAPFRYRSVLVGWVVEMMSSPIQYLCQIHPSFFSVMAALSLGF